MLIMLIKRSTIELLHFLEKPVCWEPLTGAYIYFSTPRLMPRISTNRVDLFKSMMVQVLVLSCFQNGLLQLKFKKSMVVPYGFHLFRRTCHDSS